MLYRVHFFPGLCLLVLGFGLQLQILRLLAERRVRRRVLTMAALASTVLLVLGYLLEFHRGRAVFPCLVVHVVECAAIVEPSC